MAEAAVAFVLDKLKDLLAYHVNMMNSSDQKEMTELEKEFEELKALLKDAATKRRKSPEQDMEREIVKVVYEVEDMIDVYVSQQFEAEKSNKIISKFSGLFRHKIDISLEVLRKQKLKPLVDLIRTELPILPITDEPQSGQEQETLVGTSYKALRPHNIIGLEDELDTLITDINKYSDKLEVISITGLPGTGKTTMGRRIFCEPRIEYEFPARIWINVSEEVNMKDVCLAILRTFTSNHRHSEPADELIPIVSEYLSMGKFFLVLDDVWTMEAWDQIKKVLPMENEMGKVLVITNVDKVASCVNPERNSHRLRFLTDEESWDLLQLQVFDQISTCPVELCELGKVIAARCKGVPISIVLIGGILIDKIIRTGLEQVAVLQKEWAEVSERMRTYLMNDMHAFMASVISWSYSTLPPGLKYCFLYLGMFPEDTEIPVRKLTQLWIAEGFITHKQGKLLEDTAKDNLKELIDRNLLMVDKLSIIGEVKTCRMHSMIREFCKRQAGAEKENLFQEITMSKQGTFDPPIGDLDHCRRLYIHSHVGEFFQQTPRIPNARTFLCFSKEPIFLEPKDTSMFVEGFGLLRVLDANFIHFPKKFCKPFQLVHLRYLFITFCNEQSMSLPEPMTLLWNLQTLVVNTSSPTLLLKGSIWKMVHLRHFETKASLELVGGKGGGGENLQTLARLSSECLTDELLNKAKNLKKLGIRGKL